LNHLLGVILCRLNPKILEGYEILQAHYQPGPWICYFAHRKYGTPYTFYSHGICRELYPRTIDMETVPEKGFARSTLRNLRACLDLDHESVENAALCFANSHYIERQITRLYGIRNVSVLRPGVDIERFRPMSMRDTEVVAQRYEIRTPFILTSNKHIGYKKIEWLIEMMPTILKDCPEASLVIVGSPSREYTPKLLKVRKSLDLVNKVIFLGRISDHDLAALYSRATVYAFSPPDEDFGLGPVEAMCCGTPPVAWDAAGPGETITNGKNGLLAKPYDIQDFASKCLKLLTDTELRSKLSMNALGARQEFSWETHVSQLMQELSRLS
jgi:glycosyltransferase involved in cell wall biosynthesis